MSGLQRQLLLASLMVSHHRTYPPHDRPLRITPRNTLSLWFLYQFLMVLSRFLFAANQSVRGRSVWRIVRRLPRREKPREIGQNADHPLVSPQMMSGKRRAGDQRGWLLHSPRPDAVWVVRRRVGLGEPTAAKPRHFAAGRTTAALASHRGLVRHCTQSGPTRRAVPLAADRIMPVSRDRSRLRLG